MSSSDDAQLLFIKNCVAEGRIHWTYHANLRLQQRLIERKVVMQSVASYEVIEAYPSHEGSKYLPSVLVRTEFENRIFHILFALDENDHHVRVITLYQPAPEKWDAAFRKRIK